MVKTLEQEFDCSGICNSARFWASKDIKEGPPKQACIYTLKESFDENIVLLGWAMVATAVMTMLTCCCHCGLYAEKSPATKNGVTKRKFIFD